jgi:CHRD domain
MRAQVTIGRRETGGLRMRNRPRASLAFALALGLVASLAVASVVQAAPTTLTATLAGVAEGENPGDPDGSGTATVMIDPETGEACWNLSATGIGPVTQSHIHVGGEGESGDIVVNLDTDGFEGSSEGCVEGEDAAAIQAVIDDPAGHYVNLHTEEFPPGAIRGQLAASAPNTALPAPEPTSPLAILGALLLATGLGVGLRTWRPLGSRV